MYVLATRFGNVSAWVTVVDCSGAELDDVKLEFAVAVDAEPADELRFVVAADELTADELEFVAVTGKEQRDKTKKT